MLLAALHEKMCMHAGTTPSLTNHFYLQYFPVFFFLLVMTRMMTMATRIKTKKSKL